MSNPFDGTRPPTKEEFLAQSVKMQHEADLAARDARDFLFRGMGYDSERAWELSSSKIGYYKQHDDGSETFIPYESW